MICSLFNIMVIYFYGHSLLLTLNYRYIPGCISHCSLSFVIMCFFQIPKSSSIPHQSKMHVTSTSCFTGQRQQTMEPQPGPQIKTLLISQDWDICHSLGSIGYKNLFCNILNIVFPYKPIRTELVFKYHSSYFIMDYVLNQFCQVQNSMP